MQLFNLSKGQAKQFELVLAEQIKEFSPSLVSIQNSDQREALKDLIKGVEKQPEIVVGQEGITEVASHPDAEAVVTGIVGCAGLGPTCAAISKGKDICLANKETLIAGEETAVPESSRDEVSPDLMRL